MRYLNVFKDGFERQSNVDGEWILDREDRKK